MNTCAFCGKGLFEEVQCVRCKKVCCHQCVHKTLSGYIGNCCCEIPVEVMRRAFFTENDMNIIREKLNKINMSDDNIPSMGKTKKEKIVVKDAADVKVEEAPSAPVANQQEIINAIKLKKEEIKKMASELKKSRRELGNLEDTLYVSN